MSLSACFVQKKCVVGVCGLDSRHVPYLYFALSPPFLALSLTHTLSRSHSLTFFPFLLSILHVAPLTWCQIHWFSIFNSFMMVIFLVGLVAMILMRTLRKDFARYGRDEDTLDDIVSVSVSSI